MCGAAPIKNADGGFTPRHPGKSPEQQLTEHLAETFGATIDAGALRTFLVENWRTVSTLAHAIHDEAMREKYPSAYQRRTA